MICVVFAGEENSRVQAHIDGDEFSAHILTDETEYNIEVRKSVKVLVKIREATLMFIKLINLILPPSILKKDNTGISCLFHIYLLIYLPFPSLPRCYLISPNSSGLSFLCLAL